MGGGAVNDDVRAAYIDRQGRARCIVYPFCGETFSADDALPWCTGCAVEYREVERKGRRGGPLRPAPEDEAVRPREGFRSGRRDAPGLTHGSRFRGQR